MELLTIREILTTNYTIELKINSLSIGIFKGKNLWKQEY